MKSPWRAGLWLAAALAVGNLFLHLPISDFFDGLARRYGFVQYDTVTRIVFLAAGLAGLVWLWSARSRARTVRPAVVVLVVVIVFAQALIVVNGIEAIHYPQYALLAWLLIRSGLGLERSWLIASVVGAIDEVWQWQTLPRAVPGYLDWNDIVLNAVGAALGVVIAVRMGYAGRASELMSKGSVVIALIIAAIVGVLAGPVVGSPLYRLTPGGRWFHLLAPFEASVCMAVVWLAVRTLPQADWPDQALP